MILSNFPKAMADNVDAVVKTAETLQYVAGSSGDMTFRDLEKIQQGLAQSKVTFYRALTEGQKAPVAAESFMVSVNGPATLAEYQQHAVDIEAAAAAWNADLQSALQSMASSDLIFLSLNQETQTKYIDRAAFLPAAIADPLRLSTGMTGLVAAFDAVVG